MKKHSEMTYWIPLICAWVFLIVLGSIVGHLIKTGAIG